MSVKKKESFVLSNRSTKTSSILVELIRGLGRTVCVREEVACVQMRITEELKQSTVERIGPGIGHGVNSGTRVSSERGTHLAQLHGELMQCVWRGKHRRSRLKRIDKVHPVQKIIVGCRSVAIDNQPIVLRLRMAHMDDVDGLYRA